MPERPRTAVVGGGIAGVAAAVALAERGVSVDLYEAEDDLGGRLRGWPVTADGFPTTMTRGFHAFFRQYYNLRALLRRVDPALGMLRPIADYPLLHADGTAESFAGLPLTPPWSVAAFVLRSKTFALADLWKMNAGTAMSLFDVSVPRTYDELDSVDATSYLDSIGFPHAARHLAFEVFSRSFFADPKQFSAAELAAMFHIYFLGSSEGLLFDVPDGPFSQTLWRPLREHLEELGAQVRLRNPVERIDRAGGRYRVQAGGEAAEFDAIVLATDVRALRGLVAASPDLGDPAWRAAIGSLRNAPPFLVSRVWLDRPAREDRAPFLGTTGFALLDNISVLDRFEDEARAWRERTGGSVIELHAYALDPAATEAGQTSLAQAMIEEMRAVYPELRNAQIIHQEHVTADDCPLFAPGSFASRPGVTTADPTLVLAGDGIRVDLPAALMERAATTGFCAANALLGHWGVAGHDLWSVGNQGRSPLLRMAARRRRPVPTA
nr:NAD(P)/FAD-dependent oxidoreductase [Glycomyces sp. YM15]